MNKVQRTGRMIRRIRSIVFNTPEKKYFVSGDTACRKMMQNAARRRRRQPDPEEASILAWARFDLMRETIGGFWEQEGARAA